MLKYWYQFRRWSRDVRWTQLHLLMLFINIDQLQWVHFKGDSSRPSKDDSSWRDVWPWVVLSEDLSLYTPEAWTFPLFYSDGIVWMTWFPKNVRDGIAFRVGDKDVAFSLVRWDWRRPFVVKYLKLVYFDEPPVPEDSLPPTVTKV